MGENVKEKVDLYGALFVACLYVTNFKVQTISKSEAVRNFKI